MQDYTRGFIVAPGITETWLETTHEPHGGKVGRS